MSFFNDKEEVISLELTPHGKKLLSIGKFKPVFYSFHDDDVLYDIGYGDSAEFQNNIQKRILNETPVVKPIYNFLGLEKTQKQMFLTDLKKSESFDGPDEIRNFISDPIGKSSYNSGYFPGFHLLSARGQIMSVVSEQAKSFETLKNVNMKDSDYLYKAKEEGDLSDLEPCFFPKGTLQTSDGKNINIYTKDVFEFFKILEKNTDNEKENFELEAYIEEEKETKDGKITFWKQIYFYKPETNIKNNILLDNVESNPLIGESPKPRHVDHFFDISFDDQAESNLKNKADTGCADFSLLKDIFDIGANIYGTDITDSNAPFGEDC